MKKIQGIIFDMDGLIFDTEPIYYQAAQQAADELGIPYDMEIYKNFIGVGDELLWASYHEMFDADHGVETVHQLIQRSYEYAEVIFDKGEVPLKPGFKELLAVLKEQAIPRVLASSNNRPTIEHLLAINELTDEFEAIVSREDVQVAKPDPAIFLKAAQIMALPKEHLLVLEDSEHGVTAAHRAKIDVIMVPDLLEPSVEAHERTLTIVNSLHDVIELIGD